MISDLNQAVSMICVIQTVGICRVRGFYLIAGKKKAFKCLLKKILR